MNTSKASPTYFVISCRQAALALAIGAGVSFSGLLVPGSAVAAPEGKVKSMSLQLSTNIFAGITVIADPAKEKWTHFKSTQISLSGDIKADMKRGRIKEVGVYWGSCNGDNCFTMPGTPLVGSSGGDLNAKHIHWEGITIAFPASLIPVSTSTGIAPSSFGDQIVAQCNQALQDGKTIHDGHSFTFLAPMALGLDTRAWKPGVFTSLGGGDGATLGNDPLIDIDASETSFVSIPVTCEPIPETEDVKAPFELLAATLHGDPAEYAGACPVGIKLFMSATGNTEGAFEARIESKSGWKSKKYFGQASEADANGTWSKHFQDTLTVPIVLPVNQGNGGAIDAAQGIGTTPDSEEPIVPQGLPQMDQVQTGYNPGNLHEDSLRLVVTGGGKTVTTDWWKYKVTCDPKKDPAVGSGPDGLGQAVFIEQAFLTLTPVAPRDGSKCGLTVSGLIQTNVKNVNVTFRLKNHQGNTTNSQTIKTSHANNIGKFVEYIDFSTSGQGIWVSQGGGWAMPGAGGGQAGPKQGSLQIVVENPASFESNVASYDFACHDPAPTGVKTPPTVNVNPGIVTPGALTGSKPGGSTTSTGAQIAIPDPVVCKGGTVRKGKCVCKSGQTVVIGGLVSTNKRRPAYRCVAKPPVKIACSGGKVRNKACVCARGFTVIAAGPNAFRCVRTATRTIDTRVPAIACKGGTVRGTRCLCPAGRSLRNGVCVTFIPVLRKRAVTPTHDTKTKRVVPLRRAPASRNSVLPSRVR